VNSKEGIMSKVCIIIAKDEPGIDAVANTRGLRIIEDTKMAFTALTTYADATMQPLIDSIDTGRDGCIALAEK
jgi:hypothetical protein